MLSAGLSAEGGTKNDDRTDRRARMGTRKMDLRSHCQSQKERRSMITVITATLLGLLPGAILLRLFLWAARYFWVMLVELMHIGRKQERRGY